MTPEQMLASRQEEAKGLAESVQRLSSENETLKSQSSSGAVKSVTMANEVARLNKSTALSGAEDEFSDSDFALTCFVGTMDAALLKELQAVASDPRVKRIPTDEAGGERASTLYNILALPTTKTAKEDGTRGTRPRRVRSVPKSRAEYGSRHALGETTLLIKVMNFIFGDIDDMESKFEEFKLLIKDHDDISSTDNVPDILWQERQNRSGPNCN